MCKKCGVSFSERGYYGYKAKFPLYVKHFAIAFYKDGLSLRRVAKRVKDEHGFSVTHVGVKRWLKAAGVTLRDKQHKTTTKTRREFVSISVMVELHSSEFPEKTIFITEQMCIS